MKSHISRAVMFSVVLASLAPATATADARVRYTNRTDRVLYVYYSVVPHGDGIDCRNFTYVGTLGPGSNWELSVPSDHWTWVRFQDDARDAGCASYNNRYEVRFSGSLYYIQADNIW